MAHSPQINESAELASHRRFWQAFLKFSKWFALIILGIVFWLIFWLIGHLPLLPVLLVMAVAVFILGSLFH